MRKYTSSARISSRANTTDPLLKPLLPIQCGTAAFVASLIFVEPGGAR